MRQSYYCLLPFLWWNYCRVAVDEIQANYSLSLRGLFSEWTGMCSDRDVAQLPLVEGTEQIPF